VAGRRDALRLDVVAGEPQRGAQHVDGGERGRDARLEPPEGVLEHRLREERGRQPERDHVGEAVELGAERGRDPANRAIRPSRASQTMPMNTAHAAFFHRTSRAPLSTGWPQASIR